VAPTQPPRKETYPRTLLNVIDLAQEFGRATSSARLLRQGTSPAPPYRFSLLGGTGANPHVLARRFRDGHVDEWLAAETFMTFCDDEAPVAASRLQILPRPAQSSRRCARIDKEFTPR